MTSAAHLMNIKVLQDLMATSVNRVMNRTLRSSRAPRAYSSHDNNVTATVKASCVRQSKASNVVWAGKIFLTGTSTTMTTTTTKPSENSKGLIQYHKVANQEAVPSAIARR